MSMLIKELFTKKIDRPINGVMAFCTQPIEKVKISGR